MTSVSGFGARCTGDADQGRRGKQELNLQAYVQLLRADLKASKRALIKESMQL
jgi:hypothetical protein